MDSGRQLSQAKTKTKKKKRDQLEIASGEQIASRIVNLEWSSSETLVRC